MEDSTGKCEVCGNDYDKSFEVRAAGGSHTFDSFECVRFTNSPRSALTAAAGLSDTAWKQAGRCTAVPIARGTAGPAALPIGSENRHGAWRRHRRGGIVIVRAFTARLARSPCASETSKRSS
jgi:hypothetical protein